MKEFDNYIQEPIKRPNFLVFLLVLSGISVGMSLIGSIQSLLAGPDNQEAFELKMAQMSESMSELKKANLDANTIDWINEFSRQAMSMADITNFEVFHWNVLSRSQTLLRLSVTSEKAVTTGTPVFLCLRHPYG